MSESPIIIRPYLSKDRNSVRKISCETSFLEENHHQFIENDELLADLLTGYFTDYEPKSCLVAVYQDQVIGYLIGSIDAAAMYKIMNQQIIPQLLKKFFSKGLACRFKTWKFIFRIIISYFRGELFVPDVTKEYPAILHINICKGYRGQKVGERLISVYEDYLRSKAISAVHLGTFSEQAKEFFLKQGFQILFQRQRSYLKSYIGRNIVFYVFGRKL